MTDRTIIASFLSLHDLGLFTFAMMFVIFGINFLSDFGRVLEPILWEHSGKVKNPNDSFNNTKRMAIYMALVTAIIIPLTQVGYAVVVKLILVKYVDSIPLFFILSNMLYLASMATIPSVILNSVVVNKQAFVTGVYAIGAGINIILDLFIIHIGYGIEAIAFVTVISQGVATCVLYFIARKYIIKQRDKFTLFLGQIMLPFIISVTFSVFHGFFYSSTIVSPWFLSVVSILFQIIIWYFIILLFYRDYITKDKIVSIIKELYELASIGIKRKNSASI
jgi:O-antigen/teichoic acid export membrane protein